MTFGTLTITLLFVCIPLILSKTLHLGLGKDTIIATFRFIIQLLFVGYILTFVFEGDRYVYIILMLILMIVTATLNARKSGQYISGITWKIACTLLTVEIITLCILLGFHIIPPTARYIIPLSGMAIGSSMVLMILFLNRFKAEIIAYENQIELVLSLGGTPKQAIHQQLITAIKASMIPTIESQKTIGLVQIPGMMSGQIIAGADPIQAVLFQLLVLFMLLSTAAISSAMLGFLSYPTLFNVQMQLIKSKFPNES